MIQISSNVICHDRNMVWAVPRTPVLPWPAPPTARGSGHAAVPELPVFYISYAPPLASLRYPPQPLQSSLPLPPLQSPPPRPRLPLPVIIGSAIAIDGPTTTVATAADIVATAAPAIPRAATDIRPYQLEGRPVPRQTGYFFPSIKTSAAHALASKKRPSPLNSP